MKTIKSLLLAVLTMFMAVQFSLAQDYKHPFNINSSGHVLNAQGVKLGWIDADGTVRNSKGESVGKIQKKDKQAILLDHLGKKTGAVEENGTLKGSNGNVLYTISTADESGNCKILDASGKVVGTVHSNYKQQAACAIHCLSRK